MKCVVGYSYNHCRHPTAAEAGASHPAPSFATDIGSLGLAALFLLSCCGKRPWRLWSLTWSNLIDLIGSDAFQFFQQIKLHGYFTLGESKMRRCVCVCVCVCLCVFASVRSIAPPRMRLKKNICVVKKMFRFFRHVFFHFGTSFDQFPIAMGIQSSTIHRQIQEDPVSYYLLITAALCCLICVLKWASMS